ncbi:MAG TPA: DUF262 domain-containing protein [Pseudonocardiaceae bacterium]|nr:DUF262 domain-containing protein [Pseudonocardiaceae bacterium]
MKDAQKPDHASLSTLMGRLRDGRYVIPDFQREFEWAPSDIRELMRSIFLDYYIGSLLLWKARPDTLESLACEPIYGLAEGGSPEHIVLDGQQRLTAMYYAFMAPDKPIPGRANRYLYYIKVDKFMEEAHDEAFAYDWTRFILSVRKDENYQFEHHVFPLAVVGQGGWALPNWAQGYERYWRTRASEAEATGDGSAARVATQHAVNAHNFGAHLQGITEQYQVSYVELDRELPLDKVCDIFTQINSKGKQLDVFDLINALLKPKGLQLKHLWRLAAPKLAFVETDRMNRYVLQVMSILRQGYCSPKYLYYLLPNASKTVRESDGSLRKEVLIGSTEDFETLWREAVEALRRAIELLKHPQEYGVISSAYLPYVSILPAFAAIQVASRALEPHTQLDAQRKIRHWYWASVFTNRYSGSVESTAARDYLDLRKWFSEDEAEPNLIAEFQSRFRALDLRKETKRGTSVYNGIINLLVRQGARDWMTGTVPQYGDLDDHHIIPRGSALVPGLSTSVDTILNRTPLSTDTNRNVIRDRLPNTYLPELIRQNGEVAVRSTLESHFISPAAFDILLRNPFTVTDFDTFIGERQRTLLDAIENLLVKERLDLVPRLRELDASIESIELRLREVVVNGVNGDVNALPTHVAQKISERLAAAIRKNPAIDTERYETVASKLEFCDFRELQDILTAKPLWSAFERRFRTKEVLNTRFAQLAELRNGIRHSRTVDEVTRKDGEVAVLWFNQVLALPVDDTAAAAPSATAPSPDQP